jgi:alpha/beta superfamily hydrolase
MPEIFIPGLQGRLEARYHQNSDPNAPIALVLHPHPLHGGTMNNKVVYSIYTAFAETGFTVLRINFRGVGRSQGSFDNGVGELSDASVALNWLQQHNSSASHCWVAGFSFGAWVASHLLTRRPEIESFIFAGIPATNYDFEFLNPCPSDGLFLHGANDAIAKVDDVNLFINSIQGSGPHDISYSIIPDADHFFNNKLSDISTIMKDYINVKLATRVPKPIRKKRRRRKKKEIESTEFD